MEPKFAFLGTPELCIPLLEDLHQAGFLPSVVVTNPDRPVGRKQVMTPPPVKLWAEAHNVAVLQPETIDEAFMEEFSSYGIDLSIVVAYGKILPKAFIDLPSKGTINIHYSLLPRWRGASPVEAAILAGDTESGVTIQQMVPKLDAGPILARQTYTVPDNITAPDLRDDLNAQAAKLLVSTLPDILSGNVNPEPQDTDLVTTCTKFSKQDAEVSLDEGPLTLWRKYRAYYHWPRIFYFDENNKRVIITEADFVDGKFVIKKILPEGGKEKNFNDGDR